MVSLTVIMVGLWAIHSHSQEFQQAKALAEIQTLPSGNVALEGLDMAQLLAISRKYDQPDLAQPRAESPTAPVEQIELPATSSAQLNSPATDYQPQEKTIIPKVNTLVIPQMGVNAQIYEAQSETVLSQGLWRMPMTSDNPTSGNMVITAHRYLRRPPNPNTFYLLDKLQVNDEFQLYWQGQRYNYQVKNIKIVEPEQLDILYNTPQAQLTLFSCTPLFTSEKRLVVIAEMVGQE